jgi:DMSO reductase family type II enzyme chaperone
VEEHVRRVHEGPGNAGENAVTLAEMTIERGGAELAAGARSVIYGQLAEAFAFPSEAFIERLASGRFLQELQDLASHLPFDSPTPTESEVPHVGLQDAYLNLFDVGIGRPFCPLYEGSHRSGRMKLMEDAVRFYEHFGLRTSPGDHPDHICAEFEFMHYMAFKEAAAIAQSGDALSLRRAQHDFLDRHLCRWLPRIKSRLETARDGPTFYLALTEVAEEFCRRDMNWLKSS